MRHSCPISFKLRYPPYGIGLGPLYYNGLTTWLTTYIPRNMYTVFTLLCFVVVIHWLIFPYPPGLLHWHCGNLTIAPVPAKQPWWIWINTSCEFIMNDCITTTKQSTTKPCAYFLGYTAGLGPLWYNGLTTWISNKPFSRLWDEITYPFPNFNGSPLWSGNGYVISSHD